jgi:hypothetical protein
MIDSVRIPYYLDIRSNGEPLKQAYFIIRFEMTFGGSAVTRVFIVLAGE